MSLDNFQSPRQPKDTVRYSTALTLFFKSVLLQSEKVATFVESLLSYLVPEVFFDFFDFLCERDSVSRHDHETAAREPRSGEKPLGQGITFAQFR